MSQASGLFYSLSQFGSTHEDENTLNEASFLARNLAEHIGAAIITLGRLGILVVRKGDADEPLLQESQIPPHFQSKVSVRHYAVPYNVVESKIVNVSGAGDCLAAGILEAMLRGLPERQCVSAGFAAASMSLQSSCAVPVQMSVVDTPASVEFTVIHS